MVIKKNKKTKKTNNIKFDMAGWNTTDENEIERRRYRGQVEKFRISKLEPAFLYYGTFEVESRQDKKYCVEIRSLSENINSCNCPDYSSNKLGTCKHVEHILYRLKKSGVKLFKEAAAQGSTRVEIFLDHRDSVLRVVWPKKIKADVRQVVDAFHHALHSAFLARLHKASLTLGNTGIGRVVHRLNQRTNGSSAPQAFTAHIVEHVEFVVEPCVRRLILSPVRRRSAIAVEQSVKSHGHLALRSTAQQFEIDRRECTAQVISAGKCFF